MTHQRTTSNPGARPGRMEEETMKQREITHSYIGRAKCGCVLAVVVDDEDDPRWTAGVVAGYIKRGYSVERVTMEEGRRLIQDTCPHRKNPQAELFA